jgi:hypothetical protein
VVRIPSKWTAIPGRRGQGEGVGDDRCRFFSGVHDVLMELRFFGGRRRPFDRQYSPTRTALDIRIA